MPHIPPVAELQELGQALYRRKDYNAAIEQFTIAIESHADPSASLLDNRAAAYEKLDNVQSALKDARTTIRLHEQDASGYLRAGKILQKMEKYQVALEIYKRGIRKKPKNVEVLHKMHDKLSRLLSPPASVDPFTQLPIEIVDEILSYLSFRHTVNCLRVSKQWKKFIVALPNRWRDLDLSGASRPVKNSFVSSCINRSRGQLNKATLRRLYKAEPAIQALTRNCHVLYSLSILDGGLCSNGLIDQLAGATRLTHLTLGPAAPIGLDAITQVLALIPSLTSLECMAVLNGRFAPAFQVDLPNIQTLHLAGDATCSPRPGIELHDLIPRVPNLRSLRVRGIRILEGADLDFRTMKHLEHLDIAERCGHPQFPQSLKTLSIPKLSHLEMLTETRDPQSYTMPLLQSLTMWTWQDALLLLSGCTLIPALRAKHPQWIVSSVSEWSDLESLTVKGSFLDGPTTEVEMINNFVGFSRLHRLKSLSLTESDRFSDDLVIAIASNFKDLQTLDLSSTRITGVGVRALVEGLKDLKTINVSGCQSLGSDAVAWARLRGVQVVYSMDAKVVSDGRRVRYG